MTQTLPQEFDLPKQAIDLTGQRFGELVVVRPTGYRKQHVEWLCRCDCGRFALRKGSYLLQTRRDKHERSACSSCIAETKRGSFIERSSRRAERWILRYAEYGALWTSWDDEDLEKEIRQEIAERLEIDEPAPPAIDLTTPPDWPYMRPEESSLARFNFREYVDTIPERRAEKEEHHRWLLEREAERQRKLAEATDPKKIAQREALLKVQERLIAEQNEAKKEKRKQRRREEREWYEQRKNNDAARLKARFEQITQAKQRCERAASIATEYALMGIPEDAYVDRGGSFQRWGLIDADWGPMAEYRDRWPLKWFTDGARFEVPATDVWLCVWFGRGGKLVERLPQLKNVVPHIEMPHPMRPHEARWIVAAIRRMV